MADIQWSFAGELFIISYLFEDEEDEDLESLLCAGCAEQKECCNCITITKGFSQLNLQLHSLGLMKKVAEEAFLSVIHSEVRYVWAR